MSKVPEVPSLCFAASSLLLRAHPFRYAICRYLIYKASVYGQPWWSYLIYALIILQRIAYIVASASAVSALSDAAKDPQVAAVMADSDVALGGK